ncbi:MAG: hypothetical protein KGJ11_00450 [Candidatus Omnitrophica bacterium]|nr:hypothetical protein [Candidatus Omnitrophota bacterium]
MKIRIVFVLLFLGLLLVQPSYARSHTSWDVSVGVGGPYYYDPYYDPYYYHYHYYDPYYYPPEYVVASPEPVIVTQPVQQVVVTQPAALVIAQDTFTINVPNDKGGYTSVVIRRSGNGYVGPQGEFYSDFPKVSQLRMMYGK